MNQPKYI